LSDLLPKSLHGFETTVLGQEIEAEPLIGKASSFSETPLKERLFLISIDSSINKENKPPVNKKGQKQAARNKKRNRKRVIFDDTFTHNGNVYKVNPEKSGLYEEILTKLVGQYEIANTKWKRVFVLRFDLHSHYYAPNNERVTRFRDRLFKRLKREYGFEQIGFCWVREMKRAKAQHYHWVLFLDGNLIRHSSRINQVIKDAWEDETGAHHMPTIKRPFYLGNAEQIANDVIYRCSYLAKATGKGKRDKQAKDYQCSRMKK
jgi:hypothetical protein